MDSTRPDRLDEVADDRWPMSNANADRNLLFGVTALQNDFITRKALISAMNSWAIAKHRTIGEILVDAKALDPGDRDAPYALDG